MAQTSETLIFGKLALQSYLYNNIMSAQFKLYPATGLSNRATLVEHQHTHAVRSLPELVNRTRPAGQRSTKEALQLTYVTATSQTTHYTK
jgi:hypothetical protein